MTGKGVFVTFEGIDGSGKSTQARRLHERLCAEGHDALLTREPGGSPGAEEIRRLVLEGDPDRWSAETELLLFTAARRNGLEFLLEIIPSKVGPVDDTTSAALIQMFYDGGIYPDWWKLEPFKTDEAWANAVAAIERNDPRTRGIVVLGLEAPESELAESFALAAKQPLVKGFAVGRTIFGDAARAWLKGEMSDADAVTQMAERYTRLCQVWDTARAEAGWPKNA